MEVSETWDQKIHNIIKIRAKNNEKIKSELENKLKHLENDLNDYDKP